MADYYWSLPQAIDGLLAALRERPYVVQNEIQVSDGWAGEEQKQRSIWIDDARGMDEIAGMRAGGIRNNEVYSIHVVCDSFIEGGTTREAREALDPLVGEVMALMAETKRIETTNKVLAARVASWRYDPYYFAEGRGVACKIEIKVSGRR
jgi:hypothetical protein